MLTVVKKQISKASVDAMSDLDKIASENFNVLFKNYKFNQKLNGVKVTQSSFSEMLSIKQSHLNKLLNGLMPLTLELVMQIAKIIKCKATDIRPDLIDFDDKMLMIRMASEINNLKKQLKNILDSNPLSPESRKEFQLDEDHENSQNAILDALLNSDLSEMSEALLNKKAKVDILIGSEWKRRKKIREHAYQKRFGKENNSVAETDVKAA